MEILLAVVLGFLLDLLLGDPHWLPHPVRLIGFFIAKGETLLRRIFPKTAKGELAAGGVLAVLVPAVSFAIPFLLLWLCSLVSVWLRLLVATLFCYQALAAKCLKVESMRVYHSLKKGDLTEARKFLSWIVGRDTETLSEEKIVKAAVETVAENASDGEIAPLFFLLLGGAPLGFFYKAVNTMDSMIGYKNEKYLYFGRVAAKLDDVCNFIPALLSAYLMIGASFLRKKLGFNPREAYRIYKRDHRNHASPNSARTESVCAGVLGIQLAGDAYYFGKLVKKPTIGDAVRSAVPEDIALANSLMLTTSALSLIGFGAVRLLGVLLFA